MIFLVLHALDGLHRRRVQDAGASFPQRQANHQSELFVPVSLQDAPFVDLLQGSHPTA